MALLIVLWACALLAILIGGYALLARSEGMQSRYQFAHTQARYDAESGIARAVYGLSLHDVARRWVPDGRAYDFRFNGARVSVTVTDEAGKVDLNSAAPPVLAGLFRSVGASRDKAKALADAIADWRDRDANTRVHGAEAPQYRAAGRDYGPRNGRFESIEELQQVLGMTPALYQAVAPCVTLWSGRNEPDPRFASAQVLAALPNMSTQQANDFVRQRQALNEATGGARLTVPGEASPLLMGGGHGIVQSIRSEAVLPDGTSAVVRAVVRLGLSRVDKPYTVLRWLDGDDASLSATGGGAGKDGKGTSGRGGPSVGHHAVLR
ncbi:general secretion pathway protein GspK [Oleiagrimonas sp. C23AA]|nr:general secretion pathway protein GspK [Oleiagrimonas sp. C23AA]